MTLMDKLYGKCIIPATYYLRGDLRYYYFRKYKANLKKTKKEIKEYQLEKLKKLIQHCYENVDYYRKLFDSLHLKPEDIKKVEDLKKIPPLTKNIIKDNLNALKSRKKYSMEQCYSGGSTGNKVMLFVDKRFKQISRAVCLRDLYSVGINPGDKAAWIWSAPYENESLQRSILEKLLWKTNRRILFNALSYTDEQLEKWLKEDFNRFRPKYIYGYANGIYDIARFIDQHKIKIHQVEKIVCTAQKLEHRDFIEKVFNCKVIDQYGCREVNEIAIEDEKGVMHSADDFVIVELGDNNEILLTPLDAYGMPLIRYQVGDIGTPRKSKTQDNYPFERFSLSIGRSCEILRNKKGEKVHSAKINLEIAKNNLNVGEFQLIQNSFDKVTLNIVRTKDTDNKDVEKMKDIIKKILGVKTIKVTFLNKFPLEKSGKKIGYKCLIDN